MCKRQTVCGCGLLGPWGIHWCQWCYQNIAREPAAVRTRNGHYGQQWWENIFFSLRSFKVQKHEEESLWLWYQWRKTIVYIHICFKTIWFKVLPLAFYKKPHVYLCAAEWSCQVSSHVVLYPIHLLLVNVKVPWSRALHINPRTKS